MTEPLPRLSRALDAAARRGADQQTDRVQELPSNRDLLLLVAVASPLTVSWRGANYVAAGKLAAYTTPVVGDRVQCRVIDHQLIVQGKVV